MPIAYIIARTEELVIFRTGIKAQAKIQGQEDPRVTAMRIWQVTDPQLQTLNPRLYLIPKPYAINHKP